MSVPKGATHFAFCILRFAFCIFGLGVLSSPARAEKPPTTIDGRQYLPLEGGREMRYQVKVTPPLGKPRMATATNKTEQAVLNGKTYFKTTTTVTGVPFIPDQAIYYRSSPDGVYQVLEGDEESPEWLYLPAKIKAGDRWGAETPSGTFSFTAVGFEDVETPAGKYAHCLKLRVTMKKTLITNTQEQWLAPGVGSVKQSDSNPVFSSATVLEEVKTGKSDGSK
ncbi:MAG: TapB family protein [Pirellulales bacterium]